MEFKTELELLEMGLNKAKEIDLLGVDDSTMEQVKNGERTENQYILDLSTHANMLEGSESNAKEIYTNINVLTAEGQGLDDIGNLVNITRIPAQQSYVDISVSTQINDDGITVPAGTSLILDQLYSDKEFITSEELVMPSGVTSTTIKAESVDAGLNSTIPRGAITGITGFPLLTVTNNKESTQGKDIESDDDYRNRITGWASRNTIGTRDSITEALDNYPGLDSYKLIPLFKGVGTLKIICDTNESELTKIADYIRDNYMVITDETVVCELPEPVNLTTLYMYITLSEETSSSTYEELKQTIIGQTQVFINGGVSASGKRIKGLGIGEPFAPSKLINYLQQEIPMIYNIEITPQNLEEIDPNKIFQLDTVGVDFV